MEEKFRSRNQLISLLILLFTAVSLTIVGAVIMAYQFGPSGRYKLKDALIDPKIVGSLSYNDFNGKTGGLSRFIFDGIDFQFFDSEKKRLMTKEIDIEKYSQFYELIKNDLSEKASEADSSPFNRNDISRLVIKVRTESHAEWQNVKKTFQEIDIVPNNYRVELQEQSATNKWVYFYHPDINKNAIQFFLKSDDE